ncbi:hypothetical protein BJY54_003772 [Streptomyces nodosus]|nr:hypothetical protein [Streptomyces nodosus]
MTPRAPRGGRLRPVRSGRRSRAVALAIQVSPLG